MKRYYMVWIHEEEKWYYYKESFNAEDFKDGYVSYEIIVDNDIITSNEWSPRSIGKKFSEHYYALLWR